MVRWKYKWKKWNECKSDSHNKCRRTLAPRAGEVVAVSESSVRLVTAATHKRSVLQTRAECSVRCWRRELAVISLVAVMARLICDVNKAPCRDADRTQKSTDVTGRRDADQHAHEMHLDARSGRFISELHCCSFLVACRVWGSEDLTRFEVCSFVRFEMKTRSQRTRGKLPRANLAAGDLSSTMLL